jgi:hypothetical protein
MKVADQLKFSHFRGNRIFTAIGKKKSNFYILFGITYIQFASKQTIFLIHFSYYSVN